MEAIFTATTASEYEVFTRLMGEYVNWYRTRYSHESWFVDAAFSEEILSMTYGPPNGRTLLAMRDGEVRGCGAYCKLSDAICEMKRLFVPTRFQGNGTGEACARQLLQPPRMMGLN